LDSANALKKLVNKAINAAAKKKGLSKGLKKLKADSLATFKKIKKALNKVPLQTDSCGPQVNVNEV